MAMRTTPTLDSEEFVIPEPISPEDHCLRFADYLGSALKVIRVKRGISQEDLAEALTRELLEVVAQSYISQVEKGPLNGGKGISLARLELFCKHLRCRASQIVGMAEFLAMQSSRDRKEILSDLKSAARKRLTQEG